MKASILVAVALLAVLAPIKTEAFQVCGNYCGPNWCADTVISEEQCVATGIWGSPSASGNCADSCCKAHDYCCGAGDRPSCNDAIVGCIQANSCYYSICGAAVWLAMRTIENWCCGEQCPTFFNSTLGAVMSVEGKSFCAAGGALRMEFTATNAKTKCGDLAYTLDQKTNDIVLQSAAPKCWTELGSPDSLVYMPRTESISMMAKGKQVILKKC